MPTRGWDCNCNERLSRPTYCSILAINSLCLEQGAIFAPPTSRTCGLWPSCRSKKLLFAPFYRKPPSRPTRFQFPVRPKAFSCARNSNVNGGLIAMVGEEMEWQLPVRGKLNQCLKMILFVVKEEEIDKQINFSRCAFVKRLRINRRFSVRKFFSI